MMRLITLDYMRVVNSLEQKKTFFPNQYATSYKLVTKNGTDGNLTVAVEKVSGRTF